MWLSGVVESTLDEKWGIFWWGPAPYDAVLIPCRVCVFVVVMSLLFAGVYMSCCVC